MLFQSQYQRDNIDEADDELIWVGIEVDEVGKGTNIIGSSIHSGFPAPSATLVEGSKHVALVPDSALGALDGDHRLTIHYDPAGIAKCLLYGNYIPPKIWNRETADYELRTNLLDFLGMEDSGIRPEHEVLTELAEIAGVEGDAPSAEEVTQQSRKDELLDENKYSELQTLAKEHGIEDARQSKDDLAQFIVENESDEDEE